MQKDQLAPQIPFAEAKKKELAARSTAGTPFKIKLTNIPNRPYAYIGIDVDGYCTIQGPESAAIWTPYPQDDGWMILQTKFDENCQLASLHRSGPWDYYVGLYTSGTNIKFEQDNLILEGWSNGILCFKNNATEIYLFNEDPGVDGYTPCTILREFLTTIS